ncbi:ketopantoate reductase C-terminal domain-containing protein, partial [Pseudomonas aeruginosa]|uniref:ketopantoate reductase C-terminal domain-containing protein n=1 Tax=Pseudomonas aeruginosa TaxID=287 RepID=UPI0024434153
SMTEAHMLVVIGAAGACGFILPEGYADQLLAATERMPDYRPSMYHDFAHGRPLELAAIYAAPLARAAAAGYRMPRVEALYQALRFLEAQPR